MPAGTRSPDNFVRPPLNFFAPQSLVFMVGTLTLPVSLVCSEEHAIKCNRIL